MARLVSVGMLIVVVMAGQLIFRGVSQPAKMDPPRFVTREVVATSNNDAVNSYSCPQLPYSGGESASSSAVRSGSGSTSGGSGSGQCPISTNDLLCSVCEGNYLYECTLLPEVCLLCYGSDCDSSAFPTRCERLTATYGNICDQLLLLPECSTVTKLDEICYELRNTCPDFSSSSSESMTQSGSSVSIVSADGSAVSGEISGIASTSGGSTVIGSSGSGDTSGIVSVSGGGSGDTSGIVSVSGGGSGDTSGIASVSGGGSGDTSGIASVSGGGSGSGDTSGIASVSGGGSGSGDTSGIASVSGGGSGDTSGIASVSGGGSGDTSGIASVSGGGSGDTSGIASVSGTSSGSSDLSGDGCSDVTYLLCQLCEPVYEEQLDCQFSPERCMLCSNPQIVNTCGGSVSGSGSESSNSGSRGQCDLVLQTYAPLCEPLYMYQNLVECEFPMDLVEFCSSIASCFNVPGNDQNCTSLNAQYDPLCLAALENPSCEFSYSVSVCRMCNMISAMCSPLNNQLNVFCTVENNCRSILASCFNGSSADVECVYCAYFADNCLQEELCEIDSLVEECNGILNTGYNCECFFSTVQCDFCRNVNSSCNLPLSTEATSATTVAPTQPATTQFTSPMTAEATTTSPVTAEATTTFPVTAEATTTSPVTAETATSPVTAEATTTSPVTAEATTTSPVTAETTQETTQFTSPVTTETPKQSINFTDLSDEEKENSVTTEFGGLMVENFTTDAENAFRDSVADIVNKIDGGNRRKRQSNGVTATDVFIVNPSPFTSSEGNLVVVFFVLQSDGTPVNGEILSLAVANNGEQLANSIGDALNITVTFVGVNQGLPDSFQQTSPPSTLSPTTPPTPIDDAISLSPAAIVGIVIAILIVLCLIVLVIITVLLYFGSSRRKYELGTAYGSRSNTYVTNAETFTNPVFSDMKGSTDPVKPMVGMDEQSDVVVNTEAQDAETTSQTEDAKTDEDKNTKL